MIIGRRRKRGNGGNELKDTFSGNVCECKKLMSSMAWEWDGEVGAVRAGARANEAFTKVGEEEEREEEESDFLSQDYQMSAHVGKLCVSACSSAPRSLLRRQTA